ncbi:protein kinase domain-containing protein [Planctomycetaceae bacterium SH139]
MNEREIFEKSLDFSDSSEREAYLAGACGADCGLRARVDALLRSHEQAGSFLQDAPVADIQPTLDHPITERPGTEIGPYKLLQQIGEGGMGVVYMAEQKEPIKRRVALKIIKPGMDTRQVIARFEAERQALAMMDHPNIAKVLDAGATESGRPYFVMELVNGLPVTKYCDEQHLTPGERLELFVPICHAVQHAHQKGIIHRDLKPSNILVALYDGQAVPKVIDFGVAKATSQALTEKTMFTQLGQVVGTLEYMSPEQAERNQLDIDTRSDIYALGVVLYELLIGETPFAGERLRSVAFQEMLRIIREEEPSLPSVKLSHSQQLPTTAANRRVEPKKLSTFIRGDLDWIVMKALDKERRRRYESSSAFAADVERFLSGAPVDAHPPSRAYRIRKFVRRNQYFVMATSVILVGLLIGVCGLAFGYDQSWKAKQFAEEKAEQTKQALVLAEENRRSAEGEATKKRRLLYISDMRLAVQAKDVGDMERLEAILRRHVPNEGEEDLRAFEWYYLWRSWKLATEVTRFAIPNVASPMSFYADLSRNGKRLMVMHSRGKARLTVVDLEGDDFEVVDSFGKMQSKTTDFSKSWAAISSNGETVAYVGATPESELSNQYPQGGPVLVRDLRTGSERLIEIEVAAHGGLALSQERQLLAIAHQDSSIWLWDLAKWERVHRLEAEIGGVNALAFSPDGQQLTAVGIDGSVLAWELSTFQELWSHRDHLDSVLAVTYSPNGTMIITGSADRTIGVWDALSGKRLHMRVVSNDEVRAVSLSDDETLLAAASRDGLIRVFRFPDLIEQDVIGGYDATYSMAGFLPGGDRLVYGHISGEIAIHQLQKSSDQAALAAEGRSFIYSIAFSKDGKILTAIGRTPKRRIFRWRISETNTKPLVPLDVPFDIGAQAISSRGLLAVGDAEKPVATLFDLVSGNPEGELEVSDKGGICCAAFSPSGKYLAIGCRNGSIRVWDTDSEETIFDQPAHDRTVRSITFCGDENTILAGSNDFSASLWNVKDGSRIHLFSNHSDFVTAVAYASGDQLFVTGGYDSAPYVRLWRGDSLTQSQRLQGHTLGVSGLQVFRDGRTVASAGIDRTIRIWDIRHQQERAILNGGTDIFQSIALSPDQRTLAAGCRDGKIRLFRAASPEQVESASGW